jgi:hypothetical protein
MVGLDNFDEFRWFGGEDIARCDRRPKQHFEDIIRGSGIKGYVNRL